MSTKNIFSEFVQFSLFLQGMLVLFMISPLKAQENTDTLQLSLSQTIILAQDSSLQAYIAENNLAASYWQYKNYKTSKLPTFTLQTAPLRLNRRITQQFVFTDSTYRFFDTRNLNSDVELSANQNLNFSGGNLSVATDVSRLENFGDISNIQYSSTPIRIGLNQPLFAYNQFKWDKLLEPLRYQKARLAYIQSAEQIALTTLGYFFDLAKAEQDMQIAEINMHNADTLYRIGQRRFDIISITESELLNLRLEFLNNKTNNIQAKNSYLRAAGSLRNFLNLSSEVVIKSSLSWEMPEVFIAPERALEEARKNNPQFLNFQEETYIAESKVDQTKKNNRFSANLNASLGLNQTGETLDEAYQNPQEQQQFNVSLNIPVVDWGLRKGRYILAQRQRETTLTSLRQQENELEQEIVITVMDYNLRFESITNTEEAGKVAEKAYEISKRRFLQGLVDINALVIQQQRRDAAKSRLLNELEAFWRSYYEIRRLTLFDFQSGKSLGDSLKEVSNMLNIDRIKQ